MKCCTCHICLLAVALTGCASRQLELRSLPPDRPAARAVATGSGGPHNVGDNSAALPAPQLLPADAPSMRTYDPWERVNRLTYRFNAHLDESVLLPIADRYRRLPAPLRLGVHNFFGNLGELDNFVNYGLQGRPRRLLRSFGRLLINSTIGVGGLIDVAAKLRLAGQPTGLSTTLSGWGMHPGPYLVIPLLGPSTLRDGIGMLGDYATLFVANPLGFYRGTGSWYVDSMDAIDRRSSTDFRYFASGSPFEYDAVRFLYVRARLIDDGRLPAHSPHPGTEPNLPAGK